ncbi:MAG: phosphatidate cytidylyltransferase [Brachymonas sp.]
MLLPRILTAIALLAVLIPALLYPNPLPFAALGLAMMGAAAWEWGRMNSQFQTSRWVLVAVTLALCVLGAQHLNASPGTYTFINSSTPQASSVSASGLAGQAPFWLAAAALWLLGAPWLLKRGAAGWLRLPSGLRLLLGAVLLSTAWLGMMQLRLIGINTLLSAMCLVWLADTGAYAAGRTFGKRKLAASISPGKSWEGAAGGLLAVLLLAVFWLWLDSAYAAQIDAPSLYSLLQRQWGPLGLGAALFLLTAMSVVGDLVESLMKRACGVKDSSQLLPGHGGVLDRIDALLPTFVLAMALLAM